MGNVAVIAAGYMLQKLNFRPAGELEARMHFDIQAVEVRAGVIQPPELPRSMLYQPGKPLKARATINDVPHDIELTIFVAEAQPSHGEYDYARALAEHAARTGVQRVITFASMATQMHPTQQPSVFGAATSPELLDELRRLEVRPLEEGQIGGLNGLLLGVCAQRGIPGMCIMGEIPFYGAAVPNPKAAQAVLDAFTLMTGLEIDFEELLKHTAAIDRVLLKMLERMESGEGPGGEIRPQDFASDDDDDSDTPEQQMPGMSTKPPASPLEGFGSTQQDDAPKPAPLGEQPSSTPRPIDPTDRAAIEHLFQVANKDRAKAVELKRELDRLGVFKAYENRFLDLFKRAE
jgi:predicted ATP-grasp superfamily ATP-dependent carboligase